MNKDFTINVLYLSNIPLWKSVAWVCDSFYWWLRSLFSSAFHFGMSAANKLNNGSCILPGSVLPGRDIWSTGKWTKHYDWSTSLNYQSWLAVAQPQENAGCWWNLSLPPDTCMHKQENDHFILFTFFGTMVSSWAWQLNTVYFGINVCTFSPFSALSFSSVFVLKI